MSKVASSKNNIDRWVILPNLIPEEFKKSAFKLSSGWQIGLALMINILSLAFPVMMLQVYDRIIPNQSFSTLALLTIGVGTAVMLDGILRIARAYLVGWTSVSNEHATSRAAVNVLSNSYLPDFGKTDTATHLQNIGAINRLREFFSGQALTALVDLPFVVVFLALIYYLGGVLVYVPLGILALFLIFSLYTGKKLKKSIIERSEADDSKADFLINVLTGIHTAKSLGMEALLLRRFEQRQSGVTKGSYRVAMASGSATTLSSICGQLSLIITAATGSIMVINGHLSMGGLSACTLLAGRTLQPVQRILGTWLKMQDYSVAHKQVDNVLSIKQQERISANIAPPQGLVQIHDVTFGYDPKTPLLRDISIEASPGEIIAIVGDKESGKSTLLKLICGLLVPTKGTVMVDGFNPSSHSMSQLSHHIGYLPEESSIFKGTLLENITGFRNDDATVLEAKKAGKMLGLDKIVNMLPKGYDTQLVDSNADPIPPGAKQRITLARVLKNNPSLLLFDDCDRSLDKEGYNLLFKALGKIKGKSTVIMISHDQNLISLADKFYELSGGTLKEVSQSGAQQLSSLIQSSKGSQS